MLSRALREWLAARDETMYRCEMRFETRHRVRWRIARVQVQGMSFLAGVLLLNLDEADAFLALANLLNRPLLLAFYRLDNAAVCELQPPLPLPLNIHLLS